MLALLLHIWRFLRYRTAARVNTREELETALRRAPPRIVVEGNEALRAYAASLAYRGGEKAAELEAATLPGVAPQAYMVVPTVGRIRDGYRARRRPEKQKGRLRLKAGMGTVLIAAFGIFAALLVELLSIPMSEPELVRGPHMAGAQLVKLHQEAKLPTHAPPPRPPSLGEQLTSVLTPVLIMLSVAALLYLAWQIVGPSTAVQVSWRVENRVQGRLVIARVRTRLA